MKTVVITGSARGFGLELAKQFKLNGFNVVISDINEDNLAKAQEELQKMEGQGKVIKMVANVCNYGDLDELYQSATNEFGGVDIWINNAGVNQPDKAMHQLLDKEVEFMLNVDLKGTIFGTQVAFKYMQGQGYGQIYNVEGYGSNDAKMLGLTLYGTTKRAVTYFTEAMAVESNQLTGGKVCICKLTPGIMITDFIKTANGGATKIELPEKTKKVYNILGDYPITIAKALVPKMIKNKKNNAKIVWLTNGRAFVRFMTCAFNKRDFFKN